ncbi:hypothetical protein SODG_003272 [Sodalis praecaptivus]
MLGNVYGTQSPIIPMHFGHADSLQNEAVKREQFHDKFDETAHELLDLLGKLSCKHGDLSRLKAGILNQKQLKAGNSARAYKISSKNLNYFPLSQQPLIHRNLTVSNH